MASSFARKQHHALSQCCYFVAATLRPLRPGSVPYGEQGPAGPGLLPRRPVVAVSALRCDARSGRTAGGGSVLVLIDPIFCHSAAHAAARATLDGCHAHRVSGSQDVCGGSPRSRVWQRRRAAVHRQHDQLVPGEEQRHGFHERAVAVTVGLFCMEPPPYACSHIRHALLYHQQPWTSTTLTAPLLPHPAGLRPRSNV